MSNNVSAAVVARRMLAAAALACSHCCGVAFAASAPGTHAYQLIDAPAPLLDPGLRWVGFRRFSGHEGLPQNTVEALAQDRSGFVYAGTEAGLARYDGRTWRALPLPAATTHAFVVRLQATADDSVWIGTDLAGLVRYANGRSSVQALPPGASETDIEALAVAGDDAVYVGTSRGLYRCNPAACQEIAAARGLLISALLPGTGPRGPCVWVGTNDNGLFRLDGVGDPGAVPRLADWHLTREDGLANSAITALGQWGGADGRDLWIGTGRGLARLSGNRLTRYAGMPGLSEGGVTTLLPAHDAAGAPLLYAGLSSGGVAEIRADGSWIGTTRSNGLPEQNVRSLLLTGADTRAGVLWVGTQTSGIARRETGAWSAFDERNGLPHRVVRGVGEVTFPDGLHTQWIATSAGAVRWQDQHWQAWLPPEFSTYTLYSMARSPEALWIATNRGLLRTDRRGQRLFTVDNSALPGVIVNDVSYVGQGEDAGTLWIGTRHGLARMRDAKIDSVPVPSLGGDTLVRVFLQTAQADGGRQLWLGAENGVAYRAADGWRELPGGCLAEASVMDLREAGAPGHGHALWVAHREGMTRIDLDHGLACSAPPVSILPHEMVYQVQIDAQGRLYLFGYQGVTRLTPRAAAPDDLAQWSAEHFGLEDGLPALEFNRGSLTDSAGRIWANSVEGAVLFDPASEPPAPPASPLRWLAARAGSRDASGQPGSDAGNAQAASPAEASVAHDLHDGDVLAAGANNVAFEFALLSYQRDHLTRYRTELSGLEEAAGDWSASGSRNYSRLPPGDFIFRVRARDGFGTEAVPLALHFSVRAPWWRQAWALLLAGVALVAGGVLLGRARTRTLERRAEALQLEVHNRTRALAEANDKLQRVSLTDPLTGLWNRRYFDLETARETERALQRAASGDGAADVALALLDLDHFKSINDRYGHPTGDAVLVEFAARLQANIRDTDLALRWGGEEFLVILRDADRTTATALIDRLLAAMATREFAAVGHTLTVTCSIGWAMFPYRPERPDTLSMQQVLSLADEALYRAKNAGRSCAFAAVADGLATLWLRNAAGAGATGLTAGSRRSDADGGTA